MHARSVFPAAILLAVPLLAQEPLPVASPRIISAPGSYQLVADIDFDGSAEIVVTGSTATNPQEVVTINVAVDALFAPTLSAFPGTDPDFGSNSNLSADPGLLTFGDFDRNGRLDVAYDDAVTSVTTTFGVGNGAFAGAAQVFDEAVANPTVVADNLTSLVLAGDFAPGFGPDLVVFDTGTDELQVAENDGIGRLNVDDVTAGTNKLAIPAIFGEPDDPPPGVTLLSTPGVTGDFNGDALPDIAYFAANENPAPNDGGTSIHVYFGQDTSPFLNAATAQTLIANLFNIRAIAVGDFNVDGLDDMIIVDDERVTIIAPRKVGLAGVADAIVFDSLTKAGVGINITAIAAGDVNRDGMPDFMVADDNGATVTLRTFLGNGTLTGFTTGNADFPDVVPPIGGDAIREIRLTDFNNDGRTDVVLLQSSGVSVLIGSEN